jgi:pimeloyl-ACP methyl ester carboxylesterase
MSARTASLPPMPVVDGVEHRFVELSEGRMHVAEAGSGQPVVLLAGLGQSWWEWRDVVPVLAERFRVIAPDLRGDGWTALPAAPIDRTRRMQDLLELFDVLRLPPVLLVSHDLGAVTAMQLTLEHPARVASQVVLAVPPPQMRFRLDMLPGMRQLWFEEALALPGIGTALLRSDRFSRWLLAHFSIRPLPPHVMDTYTALLREPSRALAGSLLCRRMVLPELVRIIRGHYRSARFEMPTLYVFGTGDLAFPPLVARRMFSDPATIDVDVRMELVDDAAHFLVDERPEAVAGLIAEHFGGSVTGAEPHRREGNR